MKKDFDKWNNKKKYLDKSDKDLIFNEGEIWWSHFGINIGEEAYGKGEYFRRPVVILKKISQNSCIVIPTTTKMNTTPMQSIEVSHGTSFACPCAGAKLRGIDR